MLRSLVSIVFAFLYLVLTLPALGIIALIRRKNPDRAGRISQAMVRWAFRVLIVLAGIRITTIGEENIPDDRGAVFIGNHRSIYDVIMTYTYMKTQGGYIAKDSIEKVPILRIWMRYIYCFFLNRSDLKQGMQVILDAIAQVKTGKFVFIFPEGTRNKSEDDLPLLEFHEGSFRVATKTGAPIIPVSINNSIQIFERHFPWLKPVHVIIEFGKPIETAALSRDEKKHIGAHTREIMMETIERNRQLL
ncbi:MAG: lysophospholipid acyltransferase family protein [Bilifractor sp.]